MEPWLLMELDNLQSRIDNLRFKWELDEELRSIRAEIEGIAGVSFAAGPMIPLFMGGQNLKERLTALERKVSDEENMISKYKYFVDDDDDSEDSVDDANEDLF